MSFEDWRRINVDQYDPDLQYQQDDLPDLKPGMSLADISSLSQQVRGLIQRMDIANALKLCIQNSPYGANQEVIESFLQSVFEILISVKTNDISNIVKSLDIDDLDVVVKYIYTLMSKERALKQSGLLLVWLDKIVESVGEGPIIRFMSDPYKL